MKRDYMQEAHDAMNEAKKASKEINEMLNKAKELHAKHDPYKNNLFNFYIFMVSALLIGLITLLIII